MSARRSAGRPSWLRIGGVTGADTGAFAVLSAALKYPCTSMYGTLHIYPESLQDAREPGDHIKIAHPTTGAASLLFFTLS